MRPPGPRRKAFRVGVHTTEASRERRLPVDAARVLGPAGLEPLAAVAVLLVARQRRQQLLASLLHRDLFVLFGERFETQQQAGLHLQEGGHQNDELRGGLQVELPAVGETHDVVGDDARDADLPQIDLFAKHQGDEEVEWSVEDVEVDDELAGVKPRVLTRGVAPLRRRGA